jgi:hypothetical protein
MQPAKTSTAPPTPITNGTPRTSRYDAKKYSLRGELIATKRMSARLAAISATTAASSGALK